MGDITCAWRSEWALHWEDHITLRESGSLLCMSKTGLELVLRKCALAVEELGSQSHGREAEECRPWSLLKCGRADQLGGVSLFASGLGTGSVPLIDTILSLTCSLCT
jgi:hypothetical protein